MMIVWLEDADTELAQIVVDIGSHNPAAAVAIDHRVHAAIEHLSTFPDAGRPGRKSGTREILVIDYPYVVIYRVLSTQVQILGVRHTSRQWPTATSGQVP